MLVAVLVGVGVLTITGVFVAVGTGVGVPLRNFFFAKNAELINIYSKSDMTERTIATQLLTILDPINGDKYKQIGKK